jgi:predicted flavoprotein YhiN
VTDVDVLVIGSGAAGLCAASMTDPTLPRTVRAIAWTS